jgi:hypothetical protein
MGAVVCIFRNAALSLMHAPWLVLRCVLNEVAQYGAKGRRACGQADPIPCLSLLVPLVPETRHISPRAFRPRYLFSCNVTSEWSRALWARQIKRDKVPSSMETQGTFVRSDARRSKTHPPVHPGAHQSIDHSMSVLCLNFMDHAWYLSAPLRSSMH